MKEYLVRFAQRYESFRRPELEALALLETVDLEIIELDENSPFCIVRLASDEAAKALISRSILAQTIHELWGHGDSYVNVHKSVQDRMSTIWPKYQAVPFNFQFDSYMGKRSNSTKTDLINSFSYMNLKGPTRMNKALDPAITNFVIGEYYKTRATSEPFAEPSGVYLSRFLATSARDIVWKYDLKKRNYISTTSMDSELALISANLALAALGKIHYDPFTGTGSFPIACAHFGSSVLGSDLDGRSIRGAGKTKGKGRTKEEKCVLGNFEQYGLAGRYLDGFVGDLTNSPIRETRFLDGIVCDPPYGVREGLKVLGSMREDLQVEVKLADGRAAHLAPGYLPPKRPYSFQALQNDILHFAALTLLPNGRLCMWMPTANDDDITLAIPTHPALELVSVSVQEFNKWARRLLAYRRREDVEINVGLVEKWNEERTAERRAVGTADELNVFRKKFFEGFKEQEGVVVDDVETTAQEVPALSIGSSEASHIDGEGKTAVGECESISER